MDEAKVDGLLLNTTTLFLVLNLLDKEVHLFLGSLRDGAKVKFFIAERLLVLNSRHVSIVSEGVTIIGVIKILVVNLSYQLVRGLNHIWIDELDLSLFLSSPYCLFLVILFLFELADFLFLLKIEAVLIANILPLALLSHSFFGLSYSFLLLATFLKITSWIIDFHQRVFILSVDIHVDIIVFIFLARFLGSSSDWSSSIIVLNIIKLIIFSLILVFVISEFRFFHRHWLCGLPRFKKCFELKIVIKNSCLLYWVEVAVPLRVLLHHHLGEQDA